MMESTKVRSPLVGGKGKGNGGRGRGGGGGRGRGGYGSPNSKGQGKGRGGKGVKYNACHDVSTCMMDVTSRVSGKKGGDGGMPLPPAHVANIMKNNLQVARDNIDWLQNALSGINLKVLEKSRNKASLCVPRSSTAVVDAVIAAHKELNRQILNINAQVQEMVMLLNVDAHSFNDRQGNKVGTDDFFLLETLFVDGELVYGGINLKLMLSQENPMFIALILDKDPLAMPSKAPVGLRYNRENKTFLVSYDVVSGPGEFVFTIGLDGRAVSIAVDRTNGLDHHVVILTRDKAQQLADNQANKLRNSAVTSSKRTSSRALSSAT